MPLASTVSRTQVAPWSAVARRTARCMQPSRVNLDCDPLTTGAMPVEQIVRLSQGSLGEDQKFKPLR